MTGTGPSWPTAGIAVETRVERQAADRLGSLSAEAQWVFLGEEAGWSLRQHGCAFKDGRLAHDDPFSRATPKPRLDSIAASRYSVLERE